MVELNPVTIAKKRYRRLRDNEVGAALLKYDSVPVSVGGADYQTSELEAPYKRAFPPQLIYHIRRRSALLNNAIEEKVSQTMRRGWDDWEPKYEAKCPECEEEFGSEQPFRDLVGDTIPKDTDLDFDAERECPNCEEMVEMITPDPEKLQMAKDFFEKCNERKEYEETLEPEDHSSVSQSFLQVLREIAHDIQSFDDGWMLYDRSYKVDKRSGKAVSWKLENVYRAPPEMMEYSKTEDGSPGGEYWVCLNCRTHDPDYHAETSPGDCDECGCKLYEVYAYAKGDHRSEHPVAWFIRGEFAHASEYEPSRYTGFSPIITLLEESRTLLRMDEWYHDSYEKRRAPRGAVALKSSNAKATREWNKKQFDKMQRDPQHIPTLMDDTESDGDPISFINLLESPAEMQHMEMRNWFKERISAKYGVTDIMMSGSSENGGLSQSMEIQVSNRSSDRLRRIMNRAFVWPTLAQLGVEGWSVEIATVEEEDEQVEADLRQKHLNMAQMAAQLGLTVEWTDEDRAEIKAGEVELEEQGGLGEMMGGPGGGGMPGPGGGDGTGPTPGDGAAPDNQPGESGEGFADQTPQGNTRSGLQPGRPTDVTGRGGGQ